MLPEIPEAVCSFSTYEFGGWRITGPGQRLCEPTFPRHTPWPATAEPHVPDDLTVLATGCR